MKEENDHPPGKHEMEPTAGVSGLRLGGEEGYRCRGPKGERVEGEQHRTLTVVWIMSNAY